MLYSKNCVHAGETKINPNGISEKNKTLNYYLLFFHWANVTIVVCLFLETYAIFFFIDS